MQACGRSARVLAHAMQKKDQDESRKPSYWSDCTEWSNGLDALRTRDPAKAQRVPKAWGAYANAPTASVAARAREKNSPSITCRKCHPSVPPNRRCSCRRSAADLAAHPAVARRLIVARPTPSLATLSLRPTVRRCDHAVQKVVPPRRCWPCRRAAAGLAATPAVAPTGGHARWPEEGGVLQEGRPGEVRRLGLLRLRLCVEREQPPLSPSFTWAGLSGGRTRRSRPSRTRRSSRTR